MHSTSALRLDRPGLLPGAQCPLLADQRQILFLELQKDANFLPKGQGRLSAVPVRLLLNDLRRNGRPTWTRHHRHLPLCPPLRATPELLAIDVAVSFHP